MIVWFPSHMLDQGAGALVRVDIAIVTDESQDAQSEFQRRRPSLNGNANGADAYRVANLPETASEAAALALWRNLPGRGS